MSEEQLNPQENQTQQINQAIISDQFSPQNITLNHAQQSLPYSTSVLGFGILSITSSIFCYGILSPIFVFLAIKLYKKDKSVYCIRSGQYKVWSYRKLKIGLTCAIIGLILSVICLLTNLFIFVLVAEFQEPFFLFKLVFE